MSDSTGTSESVNKETLDKLLNFYRSERKKGKSRGLALFLTGAKSYELGMSHEESAMYARAVRKRLGIKEKGEA